ncbi:MAG: hypothetical protein Q9162_000270 [Coniocarpon cinnabarinum]
MNSIHARWWTLFLTFFLFSSTVISYSKLSDENLLSIPDAGDDFHIESGALLAPILVPRVPGTPGSDAVLQHLVDFFRNGLPSWQIEFQNSSSTTPTSGGKEVAFRNLVAVRDPPGSRSGQVSRLTLVAHYDSLSTIDGFVGAIDSAAPCAMLLHAARSIDGALTRKWEGVDRDNLDGLDVEDLKGIQIIFMDGEEAFKHWSDTDSVYGARAMAEEWENTYNPPGSTFASNLSTIEIFVLLDLLGASNSHIPSYFLPTHWAYQGMAEAETRLRGLGLFKSSPNHPSKLPAKRSKEPLFLTDAKKEAGMFMASPMGDDHVPFMKRGVQILHLIPSHFPPVWHQITDDGEHLDMEIVEDWTKLITAFAAEYMELDDFMDGKAPGPKHRRHTEL